MSERFLLCRPRGGLNDTLCRIEHCWNYAGHHDRHLIIDARESSLFGDFSDFFDITDRSVRVTPALDAEMLARLNALPCRPEHLQGRLGDYVAAPLGQGRGYADAQTAQPVRFAQPGTAEFQQDYEERLLVYENSGGGTRSFALLQRVRFTASLRESIRQATAFLPKSYLALHIRNTDHRTDYPAVFERIRPRLGRLPLLVCSDDPGVIEYARGVLADRVLGFSGRARSADPNGILHKAHSFAEPAQRRQAAVESLVDIVALAGAKRFFYCGLADQSMAEVSGFSLLAAYLCLRKDLLDALLDVPPLARRTADLGASERIDAPPRTAPRGWLRRLRAQLSPRAQRV